MPELAKRKEEQRIIRIRDVVFIDGVSLLN
jgi:hypothetical protein